MSKSKGNVVDPDDMIETLRRRRPAPLRHVRRAAREGSGVDRRRPRGERPLPRPRLAAGGPVVRRVRGRAVAGLGGCRSTEAEQGVRRVTHDTIRRVTHDLDPRVHLNTVVSALMEMVNELYAFSEEHTSDRRAGARPTGEPAPADERPETLAVLQGGARRAGADAVAVRAAHGRGVVGDARPRRAASAAAWPSYDPVVARVERDRRARCR